MKEWKRNLIRERDNMLKMKQSERSGRINGDEGKGRRNTNT